MLEAAIKRMQREQEQRDADFKDEAFMLYVQALQIRNMIGNVLSGESKVPVMELHEWYPDLFESPEAKAEREAIARQMYLDEREAAVARFNARFRETHREAVKDNGRNDTGEAERDPRRESEALQAGSEERGDGHVEERHED